MSELSIFVNKLINDESASSESAPESINHIIKTLLDIGAINIHQHGRGTRYVIKDIDVLVTYMRKYYAYDSNSESKLDNNPKVSRSGGVNSAKRSMAQGMATASMRFFSGELLYPDVSVDANKMTRELGVVSAQIYSDTPLRMECKKVGVVENLELFYYVEHLDETIDCALYAGESLHTALLDWLSTHGKGIEVIYFGSYNTSGVQEYIRLRDRLMTNVLFYLPDNIDDLFSSNANRELLSNNVGDYRKIDPENDTSLKKLIDLMTRYGGGLQQEVLLMGGD